MHLGPVGAADVIDQLVQVVGERVLRMRALMQLGQHVAVHVEHRVRGVAAEMHRHIVLPLDLVPEVILVSGGQRIVDIELFVGVPKRDRADFPVERRAARVAAMIVAEGTAGHGIDRGMPRRVALVIGSHDRIGVVLRRGAVIARPWRPDAERRGIAGGGTVVGRRRKGFASDDADGQHE